MKKISVATAVFLIAVSTSVLADEAKMPDFNLLSVNDSYNPGIKLDAPANEFKIDVSDSKSVYLSARSCGRTQYPKVAAVIKSILAERGVRIVDDPKDADIALTFCGSMFDTVDSSQDAGVNKEHLVSLIGTAIFTGGTSLVMEDWRSTTKAGQQASIISVFIAQKPFSVSDSFFRKGMIDCDTEIILNTTLFYKSEKDGEKNAQIGAEILASYVKALVVNHFVFDKKTN